MKKKHLSKEYVFPNDKRISWKEIDGEIILLDKQKKAFYEMNKMANYIWEEIVKKRKIKDIVIVMQKKYKNIDKKIVEGDMLGFINDLVKEEYFLLKS